MRRSWMIIGCLACAAAVGAGLAFRQAALEMLPATLAAALVDGSLAAGIALGRQALSGASRSRLAGGIALLVAGSAVVGGLTYVVLDQPARRHTLDAGFREMERRFPVFATMRDKEPELYARIRERVGAIRAAGGGLDDVARQVRPLLAAAMLAKAPMVEDRLLAETLAASVAQAKELQDRHPDKCAALLLGRPVGDLTPYLSEASIRNEFRILEEVLRAPRIPAALVASEAEAIQVMAAVFQDVSVQTGIEPAQLGRLLAGEGADLDVCVAFIAFLERLRTLQPDVGMPACRYLILRGSGGL